MDFPDFYENIEEAKMRLNCTFVAYEEQPYFVLQIYQEPSSGKLKGFFLDIARISSLEGLGLPSLRDYAEDYRGSENPFSLFKELSEKVNSPVKDLPISAEGFNCFKPLEESNNDTIVTAPETEDVKQFMISDCVFEHIGERW